MQPVLSIPASKGAGRVDTLALALPLDQRGHRRAARGGLELVAEVFVVGGGGTEHRGMARQVALDLIVVNGARVVLGGEDGRAGQVRLFFDGQRQTWGAAEVGRGHDVFLLLRGAGGVYRGREVVVTEAQRLLARGGRHIDGACGRRGRGRAGSCLGGCVRRLLVGGIGRAAAGGCWQRGGGTRCLVPVLAVALGLLVAHGVVGGRLVAVLGGAEVVRNGSASSNGY